MRAPKLSARIVTAVTLIALFVVAATPAMGLRTCMQDDAGAAQQFGHRDHPTGHESGSGNAPCPHGSVGGLCATPTMPAAATTFSTNTDTPQSARPLEELRPHSIAAAAVFHPPRA
jgi:hypothetical protein